MGRPKGSKNKPKVPGVKVPGAAGGSVHTKLFSASGVSAGTANRGSQDRSGGRVAYPTARACLLAMKYSNAFVDCWLEDSGAPLRVRSAVEEAYRTVYDLPLTLLRCNTTAGKVLAGATGPASRVAAANSVSESTARNWLGF